MVCTVRVTHNVRPADELQSGRPDIMRDADSTHKDRRSVRVSLWISLLQTSFSFMCVCE